MLSAFLIALIAVIAVGLLVALPQIARLRTDLRTELAAAVKQGADQAGEVASKKVEMALTQLEISRKNYDEAVGSQRRHTGLLYLSADADVTKAGDLATELASYVVRTLDHQVTAGSAAPVLRGGLYSGQPAVLDVVPELVEKLIAAVGAELLYSQDHGSDGREFYLRWPARAGGPAAELSTLLTQARASSSDGGPAPQAAALKVLLDAACDGYPAVLVFGPLVVVNADLGIKAGFAPRHWEGLTDVQKKNAATGEGDLLTEIEATGVTDLP